MARRVLQQSGAEEASTRSLPLSSAPALIGLCGLDIGLVSPSLLLISPHSIWSRYCESSLSACFHLVLHPHPPPYYELTQSP